MAEAWTCSSCAHDNPGGAVCALCGLALHYQQDPPLDLPRRPDLTVMPDFWMGLVWLAAAILTLALLLPWSQRVLGFAPLYVGLQTFGFLLASGGSFVHALWKRDFHRLELIVPRHSRSGVPLEARVEVIAFEQVKGLHLTLDLVERQLVRSGKKGHVLKSRRLARHQVLTGDVLRGRREHVIGTDFLTPVPAGRYMSLVTEMSSSLAQSISRFVPFLGLLAFNTQQEGGFYVLLRVRLGIFRQLQIKRVVVWSSSDQVLVG